MNGNSVYQLQSNYRAAIMEVFHIGQILFGLIMLGFILYYLAKLWKKRGQKEDRNNNLRGIASILIMIVWASIMLTPQMLYFFTPMIQQAESGDFFNGIFSVLTLAVIIGGPFLIAERVARKNL